MTAAETDRSTSEAEDRPFDWYRTLGPRGKRAFAGSFGGWGLDAYDYQVLPLATGAIIGTLAITTGEAGLLSTVTLVVSALGGALAGVLADRIGRTRTLIITIMTYTVFTVLCGFAPNYETLLAFRALQGLGFGGEWATGAILVAEYAKPRFRGRAVAAIQSAWAIGWGMAVIAYTVVFSLFDEELAWRVLFWTGAIPALLVLYLRRNVTDAPIATEHRARERGAFAAIFGRDLLRTTFFASVFATGVQGGYYTLATWIPLYLKDERGLDVIFTGSYLAFFVTGAFTGYATGGYLTDKIGRKRTFVLFAALSAVFLLLYTKIPSGAETLVMVLGFPLGFTASAIFSGFGAFLAELYPTRVRGAGQGFTYNFGRGVGAAFPAIVGFLAATVGLGGAMAFGAAGYGLAALALLGLPETRGQILHE